MAAVGGTGAVAGRDDMEFEILMSCMNQEDFALIDQSNIRTNVLIVNQCGRDGMREETRDGVSRRMLDSSQKGLSRSRNAALQHARGEFCLIADDDETFAEDVEQIVLRAFRETGADIVAFDLEDYPKRLKKTVHRVGKFESLKLSSCQLALRRKAILEAGLTFDVHLGAGTENGAGEENKFLWDAFRAGLKVYYYPAYIARLAQGDSSWFSGYDREYFYKRGKVTSYYMGRFWASAYAAYFVVTKRGLYRKDCGFWEAIRASVKGICSEKNFGDI